ncbi:MAG TPA: M28 family peptidase [Allosphingosinicella sp.]|nr:M28 family peptidase [Allosphingosinicella sp.]
MRAAWSLAFLLLAAAPAAAQESPPLLKPAEAAAIANEVSGSAAKRTVQALSLHHRMRGSEGYRAAAELIRDRLVADGLKEVEILSFPADGRVYYGTQRSRPAWNASFAELWEEREENGHWADAERVASWADQPISLAQDSVSGRAEGELVDVGAGTSESDYAGKDVSGKLVLVSAQPGEAAHLAVTVHGAAGLVSWAQNQKQAWWGDDQSLIRWGHLDTWADPAFAFMVSPARAHAWQARLRAGGTVRLRARVEAGRTPGAYLIPTAIIPGRDRAHEIVFSCHLDHPSPGANDNASGCAGILEAARSLQRLIADGNLPQPRRTIRFIWPCEVECTMALLNARPEVPRRTLAAIHLDMIGGDTGKTKSILRVQGSPPSLPSFVGDVGFAIARWVNAQSLTYADSGEAAWPLVDPEGDKRALQAEVGGFSEGSDHQIWAEGSWRVPIIYIADWPDRYIHTQRDVPANLDATKMKRAVFIAAASGWFLANLSQEDMPALERAMQAESLERMADVDRRMAAVPPQQGHDLMVDAGRRQLLVARSLERFGLGMGYEPPIPDQLQATTGPYDIVYRRKPEPKGPMDGFGYGWLDDHLKQAGLPRPALLARESDRDGPSFGYETLNLVDGRRSVQQIRDALAVTVAPAPVAEVADYLATLARLGLLERVRS